MTAASRLETALLDACEALLEVVGLPVDAADKDSLRVPVSGPLVSREEVPATAYKAATFALEVVMCGMAVMDPDSAHADALSVEEGLALMTEAGEGS